jgi:hypothetical protein
MGFLLYGGLGLLPLWLLIAYALLAQPAGAGEPSGAPCGGRSARCPPAS